MKRKFFIITVVMMLFAVQAHAQRGYYHHRYYRPYYGYYYTPYWYDRYYCPGRYSYYRGWYFDALLGYYIAGALEQPSKIRIEGLTFTRYDDRLQVKNANEPVTYLDLYRRQTLKYTYKDGRTIYVSTGSGYATISFYDKKGNHAEYEL